MFKLVRRLAEGIDNRWQTEADEYYGKIYNIEKRIKNLRDFPFIMSNLSDSFEGMCTELGNVCKCFADFQKHRYDIVDERDIRFVERDMDYLETAIADIDRHLSKLGV